MALEDVQNFIFGGNTGLSYPALENRRKIALAMAMQKKPFPKTFGEGLTYLGESVGEIANQRRLDAQEQAYLAELNKTYGGGQQFMPGGAPPAGGAAPAGAPAAAAPGPQASAGGFNPAPDYMRDVIAQHEPDAVMQAYFGHLAGREAPQGAGQVSPTGAAGPFQFTRGTGAQYGLLGQNGDQRADPAASMQAVQQLTRDNAQAFMKENGRPPTLPELALMHQQGGVTGARMIAGTGNAPANNLAVNNVDPRLPPQEAAKRIMGYYGMPNAPLPASYGGSTAEAAGAPDASAEGDGTAGRDKIAQLLADRTTGEVSQPNPTQPGSEAPAMGLGGEQLASLTPSGTMTDAPPPGLVPSVPIPIAEQKRIEGVPDTPPAEFKGGPLPGTIPQTPAPPPPQLKLPQAAPPGAVAEAASNPAIVSDVIKPAPPGLPATGIPGPLSEPAPLKPAPQFGQPVPTQFSQRPIMPTPPPLTPPQPEEVWAQRQIMMHPGDPNVAAYAQSIAAVGVARRQALDARNADVFKADLARTEAAAKAYDEAATPKGQLAQTEAEAKFGREQEMQRRFGSLGVEHFAKQVEESGKNVQNLPAASLAITNVQRLLNSDPKMFTGSTADINLQAYKLLTAAGFPANPSIEATEQFKSFLAPIMSQMRSAIVGAGSQSEKEFQNLQQAVGSDAKLEIGSIRGIIDQVQRLNTTAAIAHQRKLEAFAGNDQNDRRMVFNTYGLPMENFVPPAAVARLRAHADDPAELQHFNNAFHTPDLAQRILGGGR